MQVNLRIRLKVKCYFRYSSGYMVFIDEDKKWESKFQKAYQICLDQNPLIYLKEYLIRVANLNQNLMQTRGDAISDINAAFS